jgi:hypothetical protein
MIGGRARRLWDWTVRVLRHGNRPLTHKQAWLFAAEMLVPCAVIFYVLTTAGRALLGTQTPSLIFDALFTVYICVLNGLLASYKIHRRRVAGRGLADH